MKFISLTILLLNLYSYSAFAQIELRVFTENSPPYQMLVDGKVSGIITDKVRTLFKNANITPKFEIYPWTRAYKLALSTPNTFIYAIANTPKRANSFIWVAPLYTFKPHLVGKKDRPELSIKNLEQAKQYLIAVQRGDIAHLYLKSKGFKERDHIILTDSIVASWQLLSKRKVDFIVDDNVVNVSEPQFLETPRNYQKYFPLQELSQVTYLATHKKTDPAIVAKLKNAVK